MVSSVLLPAVGAAVFVDDVDVARSRRRAVTGVARGRCGIAVAGCRLNPMSIVVVSAAMMATGVSRLLNRTTNLEGIVSLT